MTVLPEVINEWMGLLILCGSHAILLNSSPSTITGFLAIAAGALLSCYGMALYATACVAVTKGHNSNRLTKLRMLAANVLLIKLSPADPSSVHINASSNASTWSHDQQHRPFSIWLYDDLVCSFSSTLLSASLQRHPSFLWTICLWFSLWIIWPTLVYQHFLLLTIHFFCLPFIAPFVERPLWPWISFDELMVTCKDVTRRLDYFNIVVLLLLPFAALLSAKHVTPCASTVIWSICCYVYAQLGVTAGYHRLFSHRAFQAHPAVEIALMLMGTAALQGSVKWWARGHRVHHRYTDTELDPYSSKHGFWWAHIGWMLVHPKVDLRIAMDTSDLKASRWLEWQHRHYLWLGPLMAFVLPSVVAGIGWNDFLGGLLYAGILRTSCNQHATFCINSVAHWFGDSTFGDRLTPRDNFFATLLTFGEGYHNFHHHFPQDYRCSSSHLHFNPAAWLIQALSCAGLTHHLRVFSPIEVSRARLLMQKHKAALALQQLEDRWDPPARLMKSPMTWNDIEEEITLRQRCLIVLDGHICDVTHFLTDHPGGSVIIKSFVGKDASRTFTGDTGVYQHSITARNLAKRMQIALLIERKMEDGVVEG